MISLRPAAGIALFLLLAPVSTLFSQSKSEAIDRLILEACGSEDGNGGITPGLRIVTALNRAQGIDRDYGTRGNWRRSQVCERIAQRCVALLGDGLNGSSDASRASRQGNEDRVHPDPRSKVFTLTFDLGE